MSSSAKAFHDDQQDYIRLCKKYGEKPELGGLLNEPYPWGRHCESLRRRELSEATVKESLTAEQPVHVCPERDIECGSRADKWCASCPKRKAEQPEDGAVPRMVTTAPTRIWLCVSDEPGDEHLPFTDLSNADVCWSDDEATLVSVEYVRADTVKAERDALAAKVRELEADAARYRWLREQHWSVGPICAVSNPKSSVKLGAHCPSRYLLDTAIDEAMKLRDEARRMRGEEG